MAVRDSTTFVNSLSPQMSELVEDGIAWCGDIVGRFWVIRNELQKLVELKFEFFSFNTFDVSHILARFVQTRPKYSYCIFLKGLSGGFCLLDTEKRSVPCLGCFLVFILCPIILSIFDSICCVIFQIYIIIQCSRHLWREYNLSSCSLSQQLKCCTSVILYVNIHWIASIACMSFAFHGFQILQQYSSRGMTRDF